LPNNRELPAAALLRNVHEGLELPGEPADYHFLIQRTADALWRRQRNEPQLCLEVEQLCWLDISLIKVRPDAVGDVVDGHWKFHAITGFWLLIQLYEGGSDPARALQVAEIAALYGQCENARQRLARKTDAEQTPSASPWAPIPPQHLEEPQPIVRRGSEPAGDGDHPSGKMESIMGAGEWAKIQTHDWNEEGGIDFLVFYGAGPDYVGTTAASLRADETIMVENKNREGVNLSDLHMGLVHSAVEEFRQQHDLKNEESSEY
jgi:hypothetical protein